jgi:hypothetical protein
VSLWAVSGCFWPYGDFVGWPPCSQPEGPSSGADYEKILCPLQKPPSFLLIAANWHEKWDLGDYEARAAAVSFQYGRIES